MSYFGRQEMYDFYVAGNGGDGQIVECPETGELAYVRVSDGLDFDALDALYKHILANGFDDVYAGCGLDYQLALEHGSDIGPEGWELSAEVLREPDEVASAWASYVSLLLVLVPLPSVDSPEYDSFPGDETRQAVTISAMEQLLGQ